MNNIILSDVDFKQKNILPSAIRDGRVYESINSKFEITNINEMLNDMGLVIDSKKSNKRIMNNAMNREVKYHKYCRSYTLYVKDDTKNINYFKRYKCRSWRCPRCSIELSQKQHEGIKSAMRRLGHITLLTLTFDRKTMWNDEAEKLEGDMWNVLRIYLERKIGKSEFYWIREWQENGMLHKHVIISNDILHGICEGVYGEKDAEREMKKKSGQYYEFTKWLKKVITNRGYGSRFLLERPRNEEAVTKYFVNMELKQNQTDYRRNLRIHGSSRGFFKEEMEVDDKELKFEPERKKELFLIKGSIEKVKEHLEKDGFRITGQKDDFVYGMNGEKVEFVGSELGSFYAEFERVAECLYPI